MPHTAGSAHHQQALPALKLQVFPQYLQGRQAHQRQGRGINNVGDTRCMADASGLKPHVFGGGAGGCRRN